MMFLFLTDILYLGSFVYFIKLLTVAIEIDKHLSQKLHTDRESVLAWFIVWHTLLLKGGCAPSVQVLL